MVNLNALDSIFSIRNGVWSLVVLVIATIWRGWPAFLGSWVARRKALAEEKAADWVRLRDEVKRYLERLTEVEGRHAQCEADLRAEREARINAIAALNDALAGERAERMRLERLMFAEGEIRQSKAAVQAELRADPAKAPTSRERFGEGEGK